MTDTEKIMQAILDLKEDMNCRFDEVKEQLQEIDTSIGMLAEWADKVADVTRIPFASGGIPK